MTNHQKDQAVSETIKRVALDELNASFNDIVARHGLDATEASHVIMTQCGMVMGNQFKPGESRKEYRRKVEESFGHLLRYYMPRIIG